MEDNGVEGGKATALGKDNGKLEKDSGAGDTIIFGSFGDGFVEGDANDDVADSNTPKNVAEEFPAPMQIHSFYFFRWRPYDDPSIKAKIDQLDKEINKKNEARFQITEALNAKWSKRSELISQIKILRGDNKQLQSIINEKMEEIQPLQQALRKLRNLNNAGRRRICSSEEELNDTIYSLQYRIQHESIPLNEERQIVREIKKLEDTREKVIANSAMKTKLEDTIGPKDAIQDQVKLIGGDLDGLKKERQAIRSKIKQIEDVLETIYTNIQSLQEELIDVTQKREQAFESIQKLRKQHNEGNSYFYQNRTLLTKARDLAAKKDVTAVYELLQTEGEKFMSLWKGGKTFRADYEKRIMSLLDMRQLGRDGRVRNPDEKPLREELKPAAELEALPKAVAKQPKEEPKPSPVETLPAQKQTKTKSKDLKTKSDNKDLEAINDDYEFENPHKEISAAKVPKIDPAKLKQMKREEEIAKAKLAAERKKKLAEKAADKAALKTQKEAEKKLKDREKKAKKKSGAVTTPLEEQEDVEVEAIEQEMVNDVVEAPAPVKEKVAKESGVRFRSRAKGPESIQKAIMKRKKSNNYYTWITVAALLVLLPLVLGYTYLL
ncbi:putative proton pump-interactor [Medicago truncatula]|uniref:Proton pump interactor, putative n=1 Tax=Medicago truncatula TaxID=3880 RepID=G7JJ80_MEDTR|nr:proton pump-interactor 1 [Medicago truncatula]AES92637.1 proton pump interactor, putative [Medicago truncatula]RHN64977.1 putative proton pump-interactor [Medicago truncatula]